MWLVFCDCGFHSVCPLIITYVCVCVCVCVCMYCWCRRAYCPYFLLRVLSFKVFYSLIHFEFIFVYFVKKKSSWIVFLAAVQLFQHYLLRRLSFPHWIFFPPLLKMNRPCKHGIFPDSAHSIDSCVLLPSLYGLMTVAMQDSLKFGAWYPSSALLSQIVLAIWDVLCFHTRCTIIAFSFVKNAMNCIESVEILGHFNNTTYCNTYLLYL